VDSWNVLAQIRCRTFEPFEVQLFKELIEPGMTVLDIGANIGHYTLLAATVVGSEGRVYALEPNPRAVKSLAANVKANRLSNVTVIRKLASDSSQLLEFQQSRIACYSGLHGSMPEDSIVGTALVESVAMADVLDGARCGRDQVRCRGRGTCCPTRDAASPSEQSESTSARGFNPIALRSAGVDPSIYLEELTRLFDHVLVIDERERVLTRLDSTKLDRLANLYCRGPRQA
jgi:FkbM family methyltransferase